MSNIPRTRSFLSIKMQRRPNPRSPAPPQVRCVMGGLALRALKRIFIGHTAESLLNDLSYDVLAIKPPGFKTPFKQHVVAGA